MAMVRNRTGQFSKSSVDSRKKEQENELQSSTKSLLLLVTGPKLKIQLTNFRAAGLPISSNNSNNRPGHLINLSIFYLALIRFHTKFGEDRKDN